MTALADVPVAQAGPHAYRGPGRRGPGPAVVPSAVRSADQSGAVRDLTHPGVSGGRYVCELLVSLSDSSAL